MTTNEHRIFWSFIIGGGLFTTFMAMVDVPMYFSRFLQERERSEELFLYFTEGLVDIMRCHEIVRDFEQWAEEVPWMTGYFSGCVWLSLWFAGETLPIVERQAVPKKKLE